MSVRIDRLNNTVLEVLSKIIFEEVKNPILKSVVLTSVSVTNDLSFAKIYVTVLDDKERDSVIKLLNKASNFIERELSS